MTMPTQIAKAIATPPTMVRPGYFTSMRPPIFRSNTRAARPGRPRRSRWACLAPATLPIRTSAWRRASSGVMPARMLSSVCRSMWLCSSSANSRSPAPGRTKPAILDHHARSVLMTALTSLVFARRQEARHDRGRLGPLPRIALDLFPAGLGELVELGLAVVVGHAPRGADQPFLLQLEQSRVERAVVDRQLPSARLLDAAGNAVAVLFAHGQEGAQHHQRQCALPHGVLFELSHTYGFPYEWYGSS